MASGSCSGGVEERRRGGRLAREFERLCYVPGEEDFDKQHAEDCWEESADDGDDERLAADGSHLRHEESMHEGAMCSVCR